jgi:hypothetical protein
VEPPNFIEILVDVRHKTKPVIIEGPSGSGKSTAILKILERLGVTHQAHFLKSRSAVDVEKIVRLSQDPAPGIYIIDDFHRLSNDTQEKSGDIAKVAADNPNEGIHPKIIIVGINRVGTSLIQFVDDIRKRLGVHRNVYSDKARS